MIQHIRFTRHFFLLLLVLVCGESVSAQRVRINEFMAANSSGVKDPDYHENADWIELYNPGTLPVNLKGYSITDVMSQPTKYSFAADLLIPAMGYALVWADDRSTGNHTNFKLSASGESIGLFDAAGVLADSVSFGAQQDNISSGRYPDGASDFTPLFPSSPGSANLESQIFNRLAPPALSRMSGFSGSAFTVSVTQPTPDAVIRYTRDGHTPGPSSMLYAAPISIESTQVLRVRVFKSGFVPSATVTASYFIAEQTALPVFSLVTDPENFFSDTSGIYVEGTNGTIDNCSTAKRNWNQDWERPVDLELFEKNRTTGFKAAAGVKMYGGCSRLYPQKSLAFYFRGEYGLDKLTYRLFPDMAITEFNNFTLRSSGQDWWRTMFRDGMAQTLVEQGMKVDDQNYRPSVLFINGRYWGIHNIGEKLNEHYLSAHDGADPDNVDLVEISKGTGANNGDLVAYNELVAFFTANSLVSPGNYAAIEAMVDIDEYMDYTIAQIYAANGDWPGSNMKLWRERTAAARWRWMLYDMDFTFGGNSQGMYYTNTLEQATATNGPSWPNPPWSTLMLRRLLENTGFRNEFIQRYAVHMNTTFEKNHVLAVIDSLAAGIASEAPRHKIRWPQSFSLDSKSFQGNVEIMRSFAAMRPDTSRKHFMKKFGIAGTNTLFIVRNNADYGKVYTHGVEARRNGYTHTFFRNIPLKLKAVPAPGCRFVRWEGVITSTAAETTIVLASNAALTAVFEPGGVSGVSQLMTAPDKYMLSDNYPNPFNPSTTIRFALPADGRVSLVVFDLLGRELETLADGRFTAGEYAVTWNTQGLSSGVYFYRFTSANGMETRKMLLAR